MKRLLFAICLPLAMVLPAAAQVPLEPSVTYQGFVTDNGDPIPGPTVYAMTFRVFATATGGTALTTVNQNVTVEESLFTASLAVPTSVWNGEDRWLEIQVGTQILTPRQKVRPVPYAVYALSAASVAGECLPWDCAGTSISNNNSGNVGVGEAEPLSKLHIATLEQNLAPAALENDEIIVEAEDAVLGLYSVASGSWASAIALKEVNAGAIVDTWGIARRPSTATNPSSLHFTYGPSDNYSTNPATMVMSNAGNVGIGVTTPAEKLDVAGTVEMDGFKLPTGAAASRVLTSDAAGVGTWQPAPSSPWILTVPNLSYTLGSVAIGTGVPRSRLHVANGSASVLPTAGTALTIEDDASAYLSFLTPAASNSGIAFGSPTNAVDGGIFYNISSDRSMHLRTGGNTTRMLIDATGNVGIGSAVPSEKLEVRADVADLTAIRIDNQSTSTLAGASLLFRTGGTGQPARVASITLPNPNANENGLTLDCASAITAKSIGVRVEGRGPFGGSISVFDSDATTEVVEISGGLNGSSGAVSLFNPGATNPTVSIIANDAPDSTDEGGRIALRHPSGFTGVEMKAAEGNDGGSISLYNSAGVKTIELDAEYGGVGFDGRILTQVLEITGGGDLSEQFDVAATAGEPLPGMVVVLDEECPGKLRVSNTAYDHKVAGVVSGAGGVKPGLLMGQRGSIADGQHPIALTGRVYVFVDADIAPIKVGDLLTTSNTPGHAMKAVDREAAGGATLGKAMTNLESGRGLVLVLVNLQ